jgi:hypothetical protein
MWSWEDDLQLFCLPDCDEKDGLLLMRAGGSRMSRYFETIKTEMK